VIPDLDDSAAWSRLLAPVVADMLLDLGWISEGQVEATVMALS
jgi:hypothetical protein